MSFSARFRKWFSRTPTPIQNTRTQAAARKPTKLALETLEDRLAPAGINYDDGTDTLTFTADVGETDNVTVTSPGVNAVRIVVSGGDMISLTGDTAAPAGAFTLSAGNTQLDIDTSLAPLAQFSVNLGDMNDVLALGPLTITGNFSADSDTINLGGTVTAGGDVTLTAVNSLTDGADDDIADIVGDVITLTVTGAGNQIGGGGANFLEVDAASQLNAATSDANIALKNVAGNLSLGALNAGNAFIFLTALNGAITDANAAAVNLTAADGVSLATTGTSSAIGTSLDAIETAIGAFSAETDDGGIYIADSNVPGLTINNVLAKEGGQIPYVDGSNQIVVLDPLPANTNPHPGVHDVSISATGPILLNSVTAPNSVTITAATGSIFDFNQALSNVLAQSVNLVAQGAAAGSAVGQASDPLESTVETFSASTTNGGIFLAQGIVSTAVSVVAGGANNVVLTSSAASLSVQTVTAALGNVTVNSGGGSLLDAIVAGVITGQFVDLTGRSGIGTLADPIETTAIQLSATASDAAASIYVNETDGLTSIAVKTNAGNVTVNFTGGPLTFDSSNQLLSLSGTAALTFETTAGDIKLGVVDSGSSAVSVTAFGSITDDTNDALVDLRGGMVTLTAGAGIGASGNDIDTDVATLNATTNTGGIFIREADSITLSASATAGDIDVGNTTGNMTVGLVSALGPLAVATLQAGGAILDGNGIDFNVVATTLSLVASSGIGSGGDGLETSVDVLSASGGAGGGLLLANNKALTVNSAGATGGAVSISATGSLTLAGVTLATGQSVTLTATGALIDANVGNDITADSITLNGSKIGTSGDKIETTTAAITAATATGGIFLSNTGATLALTATALGQAADIDIDTTGDIVLGAVAAQGDTVKLRAAGSITDGNDPPPPIAINITAKKLDIAAPGGIGTGANPLEMDVDVVVTADGGAPGAFMTFTGPLLLTETALEASGSSSSTLTFDAESITIENIADNTATIAAGRSVVLRTPAGAIVFLDAADTIETSGAGTITVQAGTAGGIGTIAVAVLGNLKTAGGNILVEADRTITIGQLDAGVGDVTVRSLTGIIIDGNGALLNVIAGTTTLTGAGPTAREAELDETFRIAEAAAAAAEASAEQVSADAFVSGSVIIVAAQAAAQATVTTTVQASDTADAAVDAQQSLVSGLEIGYLVAAGVAQGLELGVVVAEAIMGPAQAIPLTGDFGAGTVWTILDIAKVVAETVAYGLEIGLVIEKEKLDNLKDSAIAAQAAQYAAESTLTLATATAEAFGESSSITVAAAEKSAIIRDAAERIRDQAILARDQANVIGTFAAPLGLQVTGVINVTAGPTDSYLQVVGATALDLIQTTGSVTLISTGVITDADAGAGADVLGTGLRIIAVGGIGSAADPIETRVAVLNAENTSGGDIAIANTAGAPGPLDITGVSNTGGGNVSISNSGDTAAGLGITVSGPITATGGTAGITVASGSPLSINADMTAPGPILLTAAETAGAGDDLTVNSGVTLESTGDSVTLRAGDDILVSSGSTIEAATAITITADFNDDAGDTTGANVVVAGALVAPAAIINVDPAANDNDTFTITPSVGAPITVDAEDGIDTLNFIADGLAVTILGNVITAAGRAPVTFNNFEFVNIINSAGGGSITLLTAPGAADALILTGTGQKAGTFTLNGGVPISFTGVDDFTFNAGDMADTANVTPFATSVLPWNVAVKIDGGDGADRITYNNVAGLRDTTEVTATGPQAGHIDSPGVTSALHSQLVTFTNVEDLTVNANVGEDEKLIVNHRDTSASDTSNLLFDPGAGDDLQLVGLFDMIIDTDNYVGLTINGRGGDDTINVTPGPIPVFVDGGDPIGSTAGDTIHLLPPGDFVLEAGPQNDEGGMNADGAQRVSWDHIEAISVTGGGGSGVFLGTNGDDDITIIARDGSTHAAADGVQDFTVSLNNGPSVLFLNTANFQVDALAGDDDIVVRYTAPNGAVWDVQLGIAGGEPTAGSDTVLVEGTAGADNIRFEQLSAEGATIVGLGANIAVTTTEHLIYNGQGGGDNMTLDTPASNTIIYFTPGADANSAEINLRQAVGGELLGFSFVNVNGFNASLTIDSDPGLDDTLVVYGTGDDDLFTVTDDGDVRVGNPYPSPTPFKTVVIHTDDGNGQAVDRLDLLGGDGDDVFNIDGDHPFSGFDAIGGFPAVPGINIQGGGPTASDVVNFFVDEEDVFVDLTNNTISEDFFGSVLYSGVERVNINATDSNDLVILGTDGEDTIDFRPVDFGRGSFTASSTGEFIASHPLFTYILLGDSLITVNGGDSVDSVGLIATAGNDTIDAFQFDDNTLIYRQNAFGQVFDLNNVEEVKLDALAGDDLIRVGVTDSLVDESTASWRFAVDAGENNTSDRLIVRDDGLGDLTILRQAPDQRSGSATVGAYNPISYKNVERFDIAPIGPVTGGTGTDGLGRVVVFHSDPFEYNDTRVNSGELVRVGESSNSPNIDPGAISNPFGDDFDLPGDEDWYVFRPQNTNTYQIQIIWTQIQSLSNGRAGLPGNGELSLDIYDAYGNPIVAGTTVIDPRNENNVVVASGGHRATTTAIFGATDDPAFAQFNTIYVRVKGAGDQPTSAINVYDFGNLSGVGSDVPGVTNVDVFGPQVTDVTIPDVDDDPDTIGDESAYNLFNPKPTDGPTPLITQLRIDLRDLPNRAPGFLYGAIDPSLFVADSDGNKPAKNLFFVVGDHYGSAPIDDVVLTNETVVQGEPATAFITIYFDVDSMVDKDGDGIPESVSPFYGALPDDRWTLIIDDGLYDPPGNSLDGESNASQPLAVPNFPSGNNVAGADFVARFTVDSRPEIGTFAETRVFIDMNGDGAFNTQLTGDASDHDLSFKFGGVSDRLFAGNFNSANANVHNAFDKLGAYGRVNGKYRMLLDFDGDGRPDFSKVLSIQVKNGSPISGNFNAAHPGDEIGLFDGTKWYLDTDGNNDINPGDRIITSTMKGIPLVGDFDGDGREDLATYQPDNDLFQFDFALDGLDGKADDTGTAFAFPGVREYPVAADMDMDGVDDIGLYVPAPLGGEAGELADWYFLVSAGLAIPGRADHFGHNFSPVPLGTDLYFNFGNNFAIPLVGNFDPPVSTVKPTSQTVTNLSTTKKADVDLSVGVQLAGSGSMAGLVSRAASASGNMYWAGLVNKNDQFTFEIRRRVGGVWKTILSKSVSQGVGEVRFVVKGTKLKVFLDGKAIGTVSDAALKTGYFGTMQTVGTTLANYTEL